jgi:acyl-CoA thioester hydrolase
MTMDLPRKDARPLEVEIPLTVRTYDVDFSGVVSQLTYHRWLEELWVAMLTRHDGIQRPIDAGHVPVVARTALHARQAVGLGESLRARMWLSALGRCRWTLTAEFEAGGGLVATAEQSGCFVDLETRRPLRLPGALARLRDGVPPPGSGQPASAGVRPRVSEPGRLRRLLGGRPLDPA